MNYQQIKIICTNRARVFSNCATGGGDPSTDAGASAIDPNQHLAPVIGGGKTFNVVVVIGLAVAVILLSILVFKQFKK